jgi:ribosome-associated heat shock protein Hsp15
MGRADQDEPVRIDKWLWATRFFKTRGVAREAISGGKVHLNGQRVKPGRNLSVGDQLSVQRGQDEYLIEVLELSSRRGPAVVAQSLYQESEESRLKREKMAEQRKLEREEHAGRERRPDKRQRRRLVRFKQNIE